MVAEPVAGPFPHFLGEYVSRVVFDVVGEVLFGVNGFIGTCNHAHATPDLADRTPAVCLPEVQVQCTGSDERGDVGRVSVGINSRNKIGKAVQHVAVVNRPVGG